MPSVPLRPCPRPHCGALVPGGGLCAKHRQRVNHYDSEWARFSKAYLARHPWCGDRESSAPATTHSQCAARGVLTPATQTDHIHPWHGDASLLYDLANLQALCASCHTRKTNAFDGGLGR